MKSYSNTNTPSDVHKRILSAKTNEDGHSCPKTKKERVSTLNEYHTPISLAPSKTDSVTKLKTICINQSNTYTNQDYYITASQIQKICGVSASKSYSIIKELNEELKNNGFITIRGKVLKSYFLKKIGANLT